MSNTCTPLGTNPHPCTTCLTPLLPVAVSTQCYSPPLACSSQWAGPVSLLLWFVQGLQASSGDGRGQRRNGR